LFFIEAKTTQENVVGKFQYKRMLRLHKMKSDANEFNALEITYRFFFTWVFVSLLWVIY